MTWRLLILSVLIAILVIIKSEKGLQFAKCLRVLMQETGVLDKAWKNQLLRSRLMLYLVYLFQMVMDVPNIGIINIYEWPENLMGIEYTISILIEGPAVTLKLIALSGPNVELVLRFSFLKELACSQKTWFQSGSNSLLV